MQDRVLSRIEELSRTLGDLVDKRDQAINDLRRIDYEIDSVSMILFELKSLLDQEESKVD
jgi:hypothetical protein